MQRSVPALLSIALLLGGCGGGEMSMTEYGERLDAAATEASQRAEGLFADAVWTADATPRQLEALLERGLREIRIPLQETVDGIDPPAQITDLHDLMWDWHSDFISVEEALIPVCDRRGQADLRRLPGQTGRHRSARRLCRYAVDTERDEGGRRGGAGLPMVPGGSRRCVPVPARFVDVL